MTPAEIGQAIEELTRHTIEAIKLAQETKALVLQSIAGDKPSFDLDVRIDPTPYKDKPGWTGPSQVGKKLSECPVEWLEYAASMFEGFARKAKAGDEKTSNGGSKEEWNMKIADACRRWAKWNRAHAPMQPAHPVLPF